MIKLIIFAGLLSLSVACRETRSINSSEFKELQGSRNIEVSDEEAEAMLEAIIDRIERGEDLTASMTKIIQMVMAKRGPDYPWKGLTLAPNLTARLDTKRETYRSLYRRALDRFGFVPGCDGLLFTSLLVAGGLDHDLSLAESKTAPGQWHRSATQDCLETGQSASTISRDMLLGLSLALWKSKDAATVQRLLRYSESQEGRLGKAINAKELASRATMTPQLLSLLSEIDFQLTGGSPQNRGYVPELTQSLTGFEAHLQVLRLLLKASLYGGLIRTDFEVLERLATSQPQNALFQAAYRGFTDGDGSTAAQILLNPSYFPEASLPSTSLRCEPYLWQRDQATADWQPCPSKSESFPAVDYFWVQALLSKRWTLP